jgi:hypothetical protein
MAITKSPQLAWQEFSPCGSGVVYLRAALVRLLWYALNPSLGSTSMPAGWWQGRLAAIATLDGVPGEAPSVLANLLAGDTDGFVHWIGERTKSLAHAYDLETRDADLETVVTLIQTKLRRTLPFHIAEPGAEKPSSPDARLFPEEDWNEP